MSRFWSGLVALGLLVGLLSSVPSAQAGPKEDAEEEKRRVERQLPEAEQDFHESSRMYQRRVAQLEAAEEELATARVELATARGRTDAARVRDREMARQLAVAQRAVQRAKARLSMAEAAVADQRDQIGAFAAGMYRQSGMEELIVVLEARSPNDLVDRMQMTANVTERQSMALEGLNAARATVAVRKAEVDRAEERAADRRREASENLVRMRDLEQRAEAAEAEVQRLVDRRAKAEERAERAKQADKRRLEELEAERAALERKLKRIAQREAERARQEAARRKAETAGGGTSGGSSGGGSSGGGATTGFDGGFARPVYGPLTSPYGMRYHPVLLRTKLHDGADFAAGCGTPIRAAASGQVTSRYYNGGYGNRVVISHGWVDGASLATSYNHLSGFAVNTGEHVEQGEVIGYVGTTGFSTGCHLHFMVYRNGSTTDPVPYL